MHGNKSASHFVTQQLTNFSTCLEMKFQLNFFFLLLSKVAHMTLNVSQKCVKNEHK